MTEMNNDADSSQLKMTSGLPNDDDINMSALDATGNMSMEKVMARKEVDMQPQSYNKAHIIMGCQTLLIIAILSTLIAVAGGNDAAESMVAEVIEKVTSTFSDEPTGGKTIRKKYPNGYYDFFPDPKDYTFEDYLLAVEEYTVLHVQKKREDEAAVLSLIHIFRAHET